MLKRVAVVALMLALVGTACSKKEDTSTGSNSKGPKTFSVQIDMKKSGQDGNYAALKYFPSDVKAHAGDSITFTDNWTGEPHSATFGRLIDLGLPKVSPTAQSEPAELAKIPPMLPDGPGDANYVSVNPCFIPSGPLTEAACKATTTQPEFNGKDEFFSSGFVGPDNPWTMKLAAGLAPGTYSYFCDLHRGEMTGKITVVASTETVPSPADVTKAGNDAIAKVLTDEKPAHEAFMSGALKGAGDLTAGGGDKDNQWFIVDEFAPASYKATAGKPVKWGVIGFHTIAINASQEAVGAIIKAPDGFHINQKTFAPTNGPPPAAPSKETGNVGDGGTYSGTGFFNSGIIPAGGGPGFYTYSLTFAKAGSYKYQCLIHPDMKGEITVS